MNKEAQNVKVTHLPGINYIVVKKHSPSDSFFYSNDNTFAIPIQRLSQLIYYLVFSGFLSPKVLEGILEEYNTSRS